MHAVDLLGRAARRRDGGGAVPPVRDARRGRQDAAELVQEHRTRARTRTYRIRCNLTITRLVLRSATLSISFFFSSMI